MFVILAATLLFALALALGWLARMPFAVVRGYLDGVAPDGEVEHYNAAFHAQAARQAGWAAWLAGLLAGLLLAGRRLLARRMREQGPAWARFKADALRSLGKSRRGKPDDQRRWVFLLIAVGAVLRVWHLWDPITYDEAFTYTYYASRPVSVILTDYSYPNNHILHTLLVKVFTGVFGLGLGALRLPALLAGIAVLPLFYLFARAMFNRYIALMGLALVAASGGLIEYSALARGYSLSWFFLLVALLSGRHFVKTNNTVSAVVVGLACALGMWAVPSMLYSVVTVYVWLMLYLGGKYESSLRDRVLKLLLSAGVFCSATVLFYSPVLVLHGLPYLVSHPELGEVTWEAFTRTQQDKSFDVWIHIVDTSRAWIALLGFAGLIYAAYITSKFRKLLFAMAVGTVPIVVFQMNVAPPRVWEWTLLVFHLSSAIALFYLLKFVQEKFVPSFGKSTRTISMALVLLVGTGALSMLSLPRKNGLPRYPESKKAAAFIKEGLRPGDRALAEFPWEAALEYDCMAEGVDRQELHVPGSADLPSGTRLLLLVSPAAGQSIGSVLAHHELDSTRVQPGAKLQDWTRLEIHEAVVR